MDSSGRRSCVRICQRCGKTFEARVRSDRQPKFCSKDCMWKAQVRREDRTCLQCGKVFHPHSMAKGLYCSHQCAGMALRSNGCIVCGKWVPWGSRYCSEGCREDSKKWGSMGFARQFEDTLDWMARLSRTIARQEKPLVARGCEQCGMGFVTASMAKRFCSDRCRKRHHNRLKDKRLSRNGAPDGTVTLDRLFVRDGGRCRMCGLRMTFDCDPQSDSYPSIDHIRPLAKGGLHSWDNVQLLCRGCNSAKRDVIVPMSPALAVAWFRGR